MLLSCVVVVCCYRMLLSCVAIVCCCRVLSSLRVVIICCYCMLLSYVVAEDESGTRSSLHSFLSYVS